MRSQPYAADVTRLARENGDFRRVLHTRAEADAAQAEHHTH